MRLHCLCIVLALSAAACTQAPPPPANTSLIAYPPESWLTLPAELPDVPKCDGQPDPIKCRADYDIPERKQHADVAARYRRLVGWVRRLKTPAKPKPAEGGL